MKTRVVLTGAAAALSLTVAGWLMNTRSASAHCDTLDGPVVKAARTALAKGSVTPVLKWVKPEQEAEIRASFDQTRSIRSQSAKTRDLADRYFFETLVRLHRASEGEPYTGLKASGTDTGPAVVGADRSLATGSADPLVAMITNEVSAGIRKRFAAAKEKRLHADDSVHAGREYVAAYVEYLHYVERLHDSASGHAPSHGEEPGSPEQSGHKD